MNTKILKLVGVEVAKAESGAGGPCLDFIASTGCVDRYREIIEPTGWKLENYLRNPVFQNAHKYGDIVFTLGRAVVTEVRDLPGGGKGLFQRIEFATEANPIAKVAYGLYAGGFLKAVSVGFVPLRWEEGTEKTEYRRRYVEQELLEVSAVAVPANPEALAMGIKSGCVTTAELEEAMEVFRAAAGSQDRRAFRGVWDVARDLAGAMRQLRVES
jgi:HK97 family phage prohead protease